jgi:hypothetical protein
MELHQEFRDHPKVQRLAGSLGVTRAEARGYIVGLWLWAVQYAPDGDLSKFSEAEIADACDSMKEGPVMVKALLDAGWLTRVDGTLCIYKWDEYGIRLLRSMRERQKKSRMSRDSHTPLGVTVTVPPRGVSRPTDLTDLTDHTDQAEEEDTPPPPEKDLETPALLERYLMVHWGEKGRVPWSVMSQFQVLGRKYGWNALGRAISEASRYDKRSLAYVEAILEPGAKAKEKEAASIEKLKRLAEADNGD